MTMIISEFQIHKIIFLSSRFRASYFNVNKNPTDATVCRYLFTAELLYAVPIRPRWRGVAVQVV